MAPSARKTFPFAHHDFTPQQRTRTAIIEQRRTKLFGNLTGCKRQGIEGLDWGVETQIAHVRRSGASPNRTASFSTLCSFMTERAFTAKTSQYIGCWKCRKGSQRGDPKASKYLGQLGLVKNFDRLFAKEIEGLITTDDKFRNGCKGRNKMTITDTYTTRSLKQTAPRTSLIPEGKRRSSQYHLHRSAHRRSKSCFSTKPARGTTSCTPSPSRSTKSNLYTKALECIDNGIKSPNLTCYVARE
jgi:hypothetical protein